MLTDQQKQGYKEKIKQYLHGISYPMKQTDALRCKCPTHDDNEPSAIVYEPGSPKGEGIWCPICNTKWDIFSFCGELNGLSIKTDFVKITKEIEKVLGVVPTNYTPQETKKDNTPPTVIPVTVERARQIFNKEKLLKMSEFVGKKKAEKKGIHISGVDAQKQGFGDQITGAWPYKNEDGLIELIDFRFEGGERKKNVISFYYNGKNVKSSNAPVKIFNRDLIEKHPEHTILIVEGAKTAQAAMCLVGFGILPISWSRGTANIEKADWSCVYNRDVCFFPDDDDPGIKAAFLFKKSIHNNCKIIPPYEKARQIKKKGADIVEVLQLLTPEQLSCYIKDSKTYEIGSDRKDPPSKSNDPPIKSNDDFSNAPFRILGVAEDDKTYFINRHGRLYEFKLDSINRSKLQMLAPLSYWMNCIGTNKMSNDDWMQCCDDIIEIAGNKDFSTENNIRGRGAWREQDGRICYYDGKNIFGDYDDSKVFLRKEKRDIGIGSGYLTKEEIDGIIQAVSLMSFKNRVGLVRLLGWSALAPFSGALEYRPQLMITGPSNTGKSQIEQHIARKISKAIAYTGGVTTPAGYMFDRKKDSGATTIEEFEQKTEKERMNREGLLGIMRQSTSNNTPKGAKGTADQNSISYMTRDMICFVSISAEIENVADENRLSFVETKQIDVENGMKWSDVKAALEKEITEDRCSKIRNMTWDNLKKIMKLADRVSSIIQDQTGKDHRFAISEGTLIAAYITVWQMIENPSDEYIEKFVKQVCEKAEPEEARNEAEELIEIILQEKVRVYGERQKEYTVRFICEILRTGTIENGSDMGGEREITNQERLDFRAAIENNGIYVYNDMLGIANNHEGIKRILRRPYGYSKTIKRHPACKDVSTNINRSSKGGKGQKCSIFDVLRDDIPF